jgi:cytosine/adenosine deaminase-related metal-dependent hydrolase
MAATGTSVIHCPDSNIQLMSGFFNGPVVESYGVNVGLGSDVGASARDGIIEQIRMAELVSKCRAINNNEAKIHVTYRDAFHWATLGGAKALGIDTKIGSLDVGKQFDCYIADINSIPAVFLENETEEQKFERFIRTGNENHIKSVIVDGISRI